MILSLYGKIRVRENSYSGIFYTVLLMSRISLSHAFYGINVPEDFVTFTGECLAWDLILITLQPQTNGKKVPSHLFFKKYCKILKNSFFQNHFK